MKCPKCQIKMKEIEKITTNNCKKGKEYKEYQKVIYWCEQDDIWIGVETPGGYFLTLSKLFPKSC